MPPINHTDFPYPLRTIDGEVDVIVDTLLTTDLDVVGTANVNNLFVSGITSIPGGVIDLADIICDSLVVQGATSLNTLNVSSTSVMQGITAGAISTTNLTSTGAVITPTLTSTTSSTGATTTTTLDSTTTTSTTSTISSLGPSLPVFTNASKTLVTLTPTGTGLPVLQTSPTLITPNLGAATSTSLSTGTLTASSVSSAGAVTGASLVTAGSISGGSMTLGTPLAASSGGTGQTSLALVTVGNATTAASATVATSASTISGGGTGTVLVQTSPSITGFITTQTAGTVLTSNGVNTLPTFQTPGVGTVSGVLPVANGGTGVTTSTGSGAVVLNTSPTLNSPSLITPSIGAATGTSLGVTGLITADSVQSNSLVALATTNSASYTSGAIICNGGVGIAGNVNTNASMNVALVFTASVTSAVNSANATSGGTGALQANNGGIGCAKDLWAGGRVLPQSGDNATSASTGALSVPNGGIGCDRDTWVGGAITSNTSQNATSTSSGAVRIPNGGLGCSGDIFCGGTVRGGSFKLGAQAHNLNFDEGIFTPFMQSNTSGNDALIPSITYSSQVGKYQNCNQFTFIYIELVWTVPLGMPGVPISIGGIPGAYFNVEHLLFSDASNLGVTGFANENLQPYQLVNDPVSGRWLVMGFRQVGVTMANTIKVYDGTLAGNTQSIVLNGVLCRTTL